MQEERIDREENLPFLQNQIDAIISVVLLLRSHRKISLDDVIHELAEAEKKAKFVCGFVDLDHSVEYKEKLKKYLMDQEFIVVDGPGSILLTSKAEERRPRKELPSQIKQYLRIF